MPLYEYKCLKCDRRTEKIENVAGPHLRKCPHCGGKVESVITAPAIQFKGAGWYVTDYAGKSLSGGSKEEKPAADSKETADKESASKESASNDAKESKGKDSATKEKDSGGKAAAPKESKDKKAEKKK